jgi:hypothetical protein
MCAAGRDKERERGRELEHTHSHSWHGNGKIIQMKSTRMFKIQAFVISSE